MNSIQTPRPTALDPTAESHTVATLSNSASNRQPPSSFTHPQADKAIFNDIETLPRLCILSAVASVIHLTNTCKRARSPSESHASPSPNTFVGQVQRIRDLNFLLERPKRAHQMEPKREQSHDPGTSDSNQTAPTNLRRTLFPSGYSSSDFTPLGQLPPMITKTKPTQTTIPASDESFHNDLRTLPSTSHSHTPVARILPPLSRALRHSHPEIQSSALSVPPHSHCTKEGRKEARPAYPPQPQPQSAPPCPALSITDRATCTELQTYVGVTHHAVSKASQLA